MLIRAPPQSVLASAGTIIYVGLCMLHSISLTTSSAVLPPECCRLITFLHYFLYLYLRTYLLVMSEYLEFPVIGESTVAWVFFLIHILDTKQSSGYRAVLGREYTASSHYFPAFLEWKGPTGSDGSSPWITLQSSKEILCGVVAFSFIIHTA